MDITKQGLINSAMINAMGASRCLAEAGQQMRELFGALHNGFLPMTLAEYNTLRKQCIVAGIEDSTDEPVTAACISALEFKIATRPTSIKTAIETVERAFQRAIEAGYDCALSAIKPKAETPSAVAKADKQSALKDAAKPIADGTLDTPALKGLAVIKAEEAARLKIVASTKAEVKAAQVAADDAKVLQAALAMRLKAEKTDTGEAHKKALNLASEAIKTATLEELESVLEIFNLSLD